MTPTKLPIIQKEISPFTMVKNKSEISPNVIIYSPYFLNYFAVIYPCAFNNSAINTAPPAAPRTVLWDSPMNL